jgi:hypothetical protein
MLFSEAFVNGLTGGVIRMGLNFRKSLSIGKLFRINFSKGGIGVSAGVKGARVSLGKNGVRETVSLPGTGLSWTERQSFKKKRGTAGGAAGVAGGSSAKTNGNTVRKSKWKTLVWVAIVAGGFLLYRSGALDSAIDMVKQSLTGKGTAVSASASAKAADKAQGSALPLESGNTNDGSSSSQDSLPSEGETVSNASPTEAASALSTKPVSENAIPFSVTLKDGEVVLAKETLYVASKSGEKFHKPDCRILGSIAKKNLVEYSSREAAAKEKTPCSVCNP